MKVAAIKKPIVREKLCRMTLYDSMRENGMQYLRRNIHSPEVIKEDLKGKVSGRNKGKIF